jgi:hypothetical protein
MHELCIERAEFDEEVCCLTYLPALPPAAFMLVPFMSVVFGYNPVTITFYFVLAATCYFTTLQVSHPGSKKAA